MSTYIELLSALQIACIWLFVLRTLRLIRDCARYVIMILTGDFYRCSCTRTRAYQLIVQRYQLALFRRGVRAPI